MGLPWFTKIGHIDHASYEPSEMGNNPGTRNDPHLGTNAEE
jgi:hypothetical protein